jgi:hypothetical protein
MMKPYHKITLIYFGAGVLWIFLSDRILDALVLSTTLLTTLQTYKGWFFIVFTSVLLYFLVRKDYKALEQREKEKVEIFLTTMSAVHHILNNFLNRMLFFKQVAEEDNKFSKDVLDNYSKVIFETSEHIKKLSDIDKVTREEIEKTAYTNRDM